MSDGGSWVAGYFATRDVRRKEIEAFWRALDPELPTLVAGDFNENAQGKAVAFLEEQGLLSALPQKWPHAKTWQWETRVGMLQAQLDHVVFGDDFQLVDVEVRREGHSDHFPVLAVLSRRD
jgi:endonuclease/exonuclease/phosphatase family metal-dependent hydrolase